MKQPTSIIVQLVHIHGPLKGEIQEFSNTEIMIGRHASCDLQFPRDLVAISRKHATIIRDGNRFKIVDQSTNGTFVNGKKITEAYLKNGDVMFFTEGGPKVSFLTRIGDALETPDTQNPSPPQEVVTLESGLSPRQPEPLPRPQFESQPDPVSAPQSNHHPDPVPVPQPEPVSVTRTTPVDTPQPDAIPQHKAPAPQPEVTIEAVKAPLIIQYGPVLQSFNELPVIIGTHVECDLTLEHPSLTERHVQFFFSQGSYRIKDLTGQNQILINNEPIASPSAIAPGDKIFLTANGPAFQFMEGGRMAEIDMPQQESPDTIEPKKTQESSPKKGSLFKKLFR